MTFFNATDLMDDATYPFFSTDTSSPAFTLVRKEQYDIQPDWKLLDRAERMRYRRYLNPQKQLEFLTGRTLLKGVLAEYLGVSPPSISLALTASGKPYLPGVNMPFFNLSHVAGYYLIGLSSHPIGVDIEPYRPIELIRFRPFLSSDEFQQLLEQPESERSRMFFRLFTAKEALLKATDKRWPLDVIEFLLKNQKWQLTAPGNTFQFAQMDLDGCCITICTDMLDT